jgi:drug/metabolite transporter (DMT)-like permease
MQKARDDTADTKANDRLALPPRPAAEGDSLRAIALMCLAVTCFAGLDCSAKYLVTVGKIPIVEVAWARFIGQLVAILFVMGLINVPRLLASRKPGWQLLRSGLLMTSTVCNFLALNELRLDQTTTFSFLTPLVVAALAGPLLGEWVGWRRMVAIMVGFCGILVVVRPGFSALQPAMLFALGSMASYALFMISTRHLARFDPPMVTLFYSLFAGAVLLAPVAISGWVWPSTWIMTVLMVAVGLFGAAGHYVFILANRLAPASTIAPFVYVQILSMTSLGFLVFGDVPDRWTIAGAAIIIGSGIYLIYRERVQNASAATDTASGTATMR